MRGVLVDDQEAVFSFGKDIGIVDLRPCLRGRPAAGVALGKRERRRWRLGSVVPGIGVIRGRGSPCRWEGASGMRV